MIRKVVVWAGIAAAVSLGASTAGAQLNKDELGCQTKTSGVLGKFAASKANCVAKCVKGARKGANPISDCLAPFGGATLACITDPLKGAEAKAVTGIVKSCAKDCPECGLFPTCNSTSAAVQVGNVETQIDLNGPIVLCGEPNADKEQAKCTDALSKNLVKYGGARAKCLAKCEAGIFKGTIPPGNCTPAGGNVADIKTNDCLTKNEGKVIAGLDKVCFGPSPAEFPPCLPSFLDTSAEWEAVVGAFVDGSHPNTFCGSPSGSFLD